MKKKLSTKSTQKGFTLIEILVALVLFSAIVAAIYPQVIKQGELGNARTTKIGMSTLENALNQYKLEFGTKKMQDVSIEKLIEKNYLASKPIDGWKNDLYFEMDGSKIIIISNGPDGNPDTQDDISNQDSEE